ncbi:MAG TPA: chemotaxis protein CheW [Myxococcales bacterium]|jgi:purine-binding chemotaxis protein CheW|nr:chemotaxis protein CheW [Myxococcales bacterium]
MRPELQVEAEPVQAQLCAFAVGAEEYAIDIHRVLEILQPPPLTQVPRAPGVVDGVTNLRGEIVPMVDLRRALQAEGPVDARRRKLLVCLVGRRKVGFLVDRVTQVVRASRDELKPVPPLGGGPYLSPFVIGVCSRGARLLLLLDLRAVLGS